MLKIIYFSYSKCQKRAIHHHAIAVTNVIMRMVFTVHHLLIHVIVQTTHHQDFVIAQLIIITILRLLIVVNIKHFFANSMNDEYFDLFLISCYIIGIAKTYNLSCVQHYECNTTAGLLCGVKNICDCIMGPEWFVFIRIKN